ncbi:Hypothetical protein PBC10988_9970 [Planctomycetales bacterium 10988]|nr:Hypothetical protein PBC10988_9970 [Planctomycetales bacterium 10988]
MTDIDYSPFMILVSNFEEEKDSPTFYVESWDGDYQERFDKEELDTLFENHPGKKIICHNVGALYWAIRESLFANSKPPAFLDLTMDACLWYDLGLMDQQYEFTANGYSTRYNNINELRQKHLGHQIKASDEDAQPQLRPTAQFLREIFGLLYPKLLSYSFRLAVCFDDIIINKHLNWRLTASPIRLKIIGWNKSPQNPREKFQKRFVDSLNQRVESPPSFPPLKTWNETQQEFIDNDLPPGGPLGIGLDALGSIVAAHLKRQPLQLNFTKMRAFKERCERIKEEASRKLLTDNATKKCFESDNNKVEIKKGFLSVHKRKLQQWLESLKIVDWHDTNRCLPRDEKGAVSTNPIHWRSLSKTHALLNSWVSLSSAVRWLHLLKENPREIRLPYLLFPAFQSVPSELEFSDGIGNLIEAPSGKTLYKVEFTDIHLRCLTRMMEARKHAAGWNVGAALRKQENHHLFWARWLHKKHTIEEGADSVAGYKFWEELPSDLDEYKKKELLEKASIVWEMIGNCYTKAQARIFFGKKGLQELSGEANIDDMIRMLESCFENYFGYLSNPIDKRIQSFLDVSVNDMGEAFSTYNVLKRDVLGSIKNTLLGQKKDDSFMQAFNDLARKRRPNEEPKNILDMILFDAPTGLTGRSGQREYCTYSQHASHLELMEEIKLFATFCCFRENLHLTAVMENSFIIEIDNSKGEEEQRLAEIINDVLESFLGNLSRGALKISELNTQ